MTIIAEFFVIKAARAGRAGQLGWSADWQHPIDTENQDQAAAVMPIAVVKIARVNWAKARGCEA